MLGHGAARTHTALKTAATRVSARVAAAAAVAPKPATEPDGVLQRWFEHRLERLKENAERVRTSPDEFIRLVLGALSLGWIALGAWILGIYLA